MKQHNEKQNLYLLWLQALRVEIAWLRVVKPDSGSAKINELEALMVQIYPLISQGENESS